MAVRTRYNVGFPKGPYMALLWHRAIYWLRWCWEHHYETEMYSEDVSWL